MKILISPAKKMDLTYNNSSQISSTNCDFLNESHEIIQTVKKFSSEKLSSIMGISSDLATLNYNRNQEWKKENVLKHGKQAILCFKGAVYESMGIEKFSRNDFEFTAKHLRILSGLYGILKSTDLILPYRLEMGTKLIIGRNKNLYQYWRNKLTDSFLDTIKNDKFIINLASNEYYKVLESKKINLPVITPIFKDIKKGKEKVISFYAKKARGKMCNYIIKNQIKNIDDLMKFNELEYQFRDFSNNQIIFTRIHD